MHENFDNWMKTEEKFWTSGHRAHSVERTEKGFLIQTDLRKVKSEWNDELYQAIKEECKDFDFLYTFTVLDEVFSYYIEFKWKGSIYRYQLVLAGKTFYRFFSHLDEFFQDLLYSPEQMFPEQESLEYIYQKVTMFEKYIFNLPKYRLKLLFNELTMEPVFDLKDYYISKMGRKG